MAASVRLEDCAFGDPRFAVLGELCNVPAQFADAWALGTMAKVWRHCTQRQVHVVASLVIDAIAGVKDFSFHLVTAELGREAKTGKMAKSAVRICGTKGRIEWLVARQMAAKKGGAANRKRIKEKNSKVSSEPAGYPFGYPNGKPNDSPPAPAPAPALKAKDTGAPSASAPGSGKKRAPRTNVDPRVKPVIERWYDRFKQRLQSDYPGSYGAAGQAIKRLPASYDTAKLLSLADRFWDNPDPFVLKSGARIEVWLQQIGGQLAMTQGEAPPKRPHIKTDEELDRESDELLRRTQT